MDRRNLPSVEEPGGLQSMGSQRVRQDSRGCLLGACRPSLPTHSLVVLLVSRPGTVTFTVLFQISDLTQETTMDSHVTA